MITVKELLRKLDRGASASEFDEALENSFVGVASTKRPVSTQLSS